MREIKFRAWDKTDKQMAVPGHLTVTLHLEGDIVVYIGDDGGKKGLWEHEIPEYQDRFVLMQYTGLKDKNGKEIYEGDIVKQEDSVREVIWFSGTVGINGGEYADIHTGFATKIIFPEDYVEVGGIEGIAEKYDFYNYGGNGGITTEDCEVIGNIYENPELLNK